MTLNNLNGGDMKRLVILLAVGFIAWYLMAPEKRKLIVENYVVEKWVKDRMKYHGIEVSFEDEKGMYFLRKGKRCKL